MNVVNLPLVLFTVVLRRVIDKLRAPQGAAVLLKVTSPWVVDTSLFKSCMYAYMFFAGIYYTLKHMQRGTIVSLAKRCSEGAVTIKDKYVRRSVCLNRNKSSLMRNLGRGREGQQRALRYIAAMTPQDICQQAVSSSSSPRRDTPCPVNHQADFEQQQEITNPYLQPSPIAKHRSLPMPVCQFQHRQTRGQSPQVTTIFETTRAKEGEVSKEATPVEIETITISDELQSDLVPAEVHRRRGRPRLRNCLTLGGRKMLQSDFSFRGDKIVRKTRSGKVYGYHIGGPIRYSMGRQKI